MLRSEFERRLAVAKASTSKWTRETIPALERILAFDRFAEELPEANTADARQCPGCGKVFTRKPKERWTSRRRWCRAKCMEAVETRIHAETYDSAAAILARESEAKKTREARETRKAERKLANIARLRALVESSPSRRAEAPRKLRAVAPGAPAMPRGTFNVGADESDELRSNGAAVIRRAYGSKRVPPEVGADVWIRESHSYRDGEVVFDGGDVPAYLMPRRACRMFARVEAVTAQEADHYTQVDITLRVTAGEAEVRLALAEWARCELDKAGT